MSDYEDLILSDAHIGDRAVQLERRIAGTTYEAHLSRYDINLKTNEGLSQNSLQFKNLSEDADGDLVLNRDSSSLKLIIEHAMGTTLIDVGLQIWNGAVLLSEYILQNPDEFCRKSIFEFGCGLGLTCLCLSVAQAKNVYATDVNDNCLALCQRNINLNKEELELKTDIKLRHFEWSTDSLNQCASSPHNPEYMWSKLDLDDIHRVDFFLAADAIYDVASSSALFEKIEEIETLDSKKATVIITLEKRYVFSLEHLNVVCEAYDHLRAFLNCLEMRGWLVLKINCSRVPAYFNINRSDEMEMWKLVSPEKKSNVC